MYFRLYFHLAMLAIEFQAEALAIRADQVIWLFVR